VEKNIKNSPLTCDLFLQEVGVPSLFLSPVVFIPAYPFWR